MTGLILWTIRNRLMGPKLKVGAAARVGVTGQSSIETGKIGVRGGKVVHRRTRTMPSMSLSLKRRCRVSRWIVVSGVGGLAVGHDGSRQGNHGGCAD
jgi:hypothetical protein